MVAVVVAMVSVCWGTVVVCYGGVLRYKGFIALSGGWGLRGATIYQSSDQEVCATSCCKTCDKYVVVFSFSFGFIEVSMHR